MEKLGKFCGAEIIWKKGDVIIRSGKEFKIGKKFPNPVTAKRYLEKKGWL